ncbi:hypothetical protein Syun_030772 [Stephania yunnanensis]|uniref:Uncharacterized protein n=1 Tax=Stephania yunnanensis TaxID=152371 RepID=A0AAP0DVG6_9MAGN
MTEAVARDSVRDPVESTDRDINLVMHKGKDMDMFQLERNFNVPVWACGQPEQIHATATSGPTTIHRNLIEGTSWVETHSMRETDLHSRGHTSYIRMLVTVDHEIKIFICIHLYSNICCEDVALAYVDGRIQMVCSLLGGRGGAQLVTEEPSLLRRSPALQSKMGVRPWASMALGGYGLGRVWPWDFIYKTPLSFETCFNFEDKILIRREDCNGPKI